MGCAPRTRPVPSLDVDQAGAHQVFDSYADLAGWIAETA